jgi:hypothetical protein
MANAQRLAMPALDASLLDDQEVLDYLEAIGRGASTFSEDRTAAPEFHAGIAALDDGLFHGNTAIGRFRAVPSAPQAESLRSAPSDTTDETAQISPFCTAVFLLDMTLLGALAAALLFHAPLAKIVGW